MNVRHAAIKNEAPFFNIIIPTKSRPDLINYALFSLHNQTYQDFTVVVSDDYDDTPCEHIIKKYQDNRFRYVVPSKELNLGMCGNWEYGLTFVDGEYVIFIQDKMFMYKESLEFLAEFIKNNNYPDIVSWSWDFFSFDDDEKRTSGVLSQKRRTKKYKKWDIEELVEEKLAFNNFTYQNKTGAPGAASPLCSAIKRKVYDEIRHKYGVVFDFINPDYGPPIRLLDFASDVYELEDHLAVAMPVNNSEGLIHSHSYTASLNFLKKSPCGIARMRYALIPELTSTNSNMISADYNYSILNSSKFKKLGQCDMLHTLGSIAIDLGKIKYDSVEDELAEREAFLRIFNRLSNDEKQIIYEYRRVKDERIGVIKKVYRRIVPIQIRRFINQFRNLEYHDRWFTTPIESFDKML